MSRRSLTGWLGFAATVAAGLITITAEPAGARVQATRTGGCRDSLWGCAPAADTDGGETSEPPRVRYDRLLGQARRGLASLRFTSPAAAATTITDTVQKLSDAAALMPDDYEAPSLLGQLELERGRLVAAGLLLRRAEELYLHPKPEPAGGGRGLVPPSLPLSLRDPALALALALLQAQEGDLATALRRYQRLYEEAAHSPRLLYRLADVLMALGRLEDATALYETACSLPRSLETPLVDGSRACLGVVVALDRAGRSLPSATLRRAKQADRGPRAVELPDFLTSAERDYGRALLLPPGCERKLALSSYLRAAGGSAPTTYLLRAEAHLQRLHDLLCTPPISPAGRAPAAPPAPAPAPTPSPSPTPSGTARLSPP